MIPTWFSTCPFSHPAPGVHAVGSTRYRRRDRVEAVERPAIADQGRTLVLEHLPDSPVLEHRVGMTPGVGDALVQEPGVELVVGLEAQPRGEEPTADDPDLVLDLPLLPSRSRRACCRFDQVVATHLHEAPVERALLADEDGLHRRLHVVVDASPAGTLEQPECPVVGVEHHLLALARISADEEHSAVAQPDVRDLDLGRHPRQHHVLVAPVELIGLARREHQRHIGLRRRCRTAPPPRLGVAPHRVVAAAIAQTLEGFGDP